MVDVLEINTHEYGSEIINGKGLYKNGCIDVGRLSATGELAVPYLLYGTGPGLLGRQSCVCL